MSIERYVLVLISASAVSEEYGFRSRASRQLRARVEAGIPKREPVTTLPVWYGGSAVGYAPGNATIMSHFAQGPQDFLVGNPVPRRCHLWSANLPPTSSGTPSPH